jgi:hypothetical protein
MCVVNSSIGSLCVDAVVTAYVCVWVFSFRKDFGEHACVVPWYSLR